MDSSSVPELELSKKLIQLVKERPCLYDKQLEDFKDEAKKSEGWSSVANVLGLEVEDAQLRWARLRVDFGRHRRKRQTAVSCGVQVRDWPLFSLLSWLAPHVKMRAKREKHKREKLFDSPDLKPSLSRPEWMPNMSCAINMDVNPNMIMENGQEDITESFIVSPDTADYDDEGSPQNSIYNHYGKKEDHSYSSGGHAADINSEISAQDDDEDHLFCRSICASLKRLSYQQKAMAKIRIQQVMYDVEFEQIPAECRVKGT